MIKVWLTIVLLLPFLAGFGQLTIRVTSVPSNTSPEAEIYIAGTMNNWNPGSPAYKLEKDSTGVYLITFTPSAGNVKFKFTRGTWESVEGTAQGTFIPDRVISYNGAAKTVDLTIAGWEGSGNSNPSTASPQVSILTDTFYIPQLNRKRKIWLYLPKDYSTSSHSYPVLYMHDGQNLFDKKTSFSGEWKIDESLDSMFLKGDFGSIVVGIDNGGSNRLNEYSPWINPQYGGGQGDEYIDFIVQTLKPYIDDKFRTLQDRDNTAIFGSSMGGLISMYAGIQYPEVFGRVGAFSSSYWFSGESYKQVSDTGVKGTSYFYLLAGEQEGGQQTGDMEKMYQTLLLAGASTDQLSKTAHADGKHSEWYWAREFPKAYKWLFEKKTSGLSEKEKPKIGVYFDGSLVMIKGDQSLSGKAVMLFDTMGKRIYRDVLGQDMSIDISCLSLAPGVYIFRLGDQNVKLFLYH
jgi:predicted alpha/beta superfamily hydrolase